MASPPVGAKRAGRNEHPGVAAGLKRYTQVELQVISAAKKAEKNAHTEEKRQQMQEQEAQLEKTKKELAALKDRMAQLQQEQDLSLRQLRDDLNEEVVETGVDDQDDEIFGQDDAIMVDEDLEEHELDSEDTGKDTRKVKVRSFHVIAHCNLISAPFTSFPVRRRRRHMQRPFENL